jgi:hypothetical protein
VPIASLRTTLESARLVLRPPRASDVALILTSLRRNEAHLRPFTPQRPNDRGDRRPTLATVARDVTAARRAWRRDESYTFFLFDRDDRRSVLGRVTLGRVLRGPFQNSFLGYWADVASQGRIIRSDNRLAVTFPIVSIVPRTLSASRQEKLEALLREAHNNFRMVRVGFRGAKDESRSAVVELDLSGAPHTAVPSLLRYSVDALHHIVRWAGASAALIVDGAPCELLDR